MDAVTYARRVLSAINFGRTFLTTVSLELLDLISGDSLLTCAHGVSLDT